MYVREKSIRRRGNKERGAALDRASRDDAIEIEIRLPM